MANRDWFRKSSWTASDQNDFFSRLKKARPNNRSQYLHIQAAHLMETGLKKNFISAISLLDMAINTYPDPINLETDHFLKARCYEALGHIDDAITSYRRAIEARKNQHSIHTDAPLNFAYFVVSHDRVDLYHEALTGIEEHVREENLLFPIQRYQFASCLALIYDQYRQKDVAIKFAQRALDALAQKESGLSYHPGIGLVTKKDQAVIKRLKKICAD